MGHEFEIWYRERHPRVIGVVATMCGDADVAEDAADEAFTRALAHWDRVCVMDAPDAWVTKVAINAMRRRFRRRATEARLLRRGSVATTAHLPSTNHELWAAVRALPERQRLAIVLRYVGDLTEADVGRAMGITRGAAAASLSGARRTLARTVTDFSTAEPSARIYRLADAAAAAPEPDPLEEASHG